MASSKGNIFQAPRGTRDFFPTEMAMRRYIEACWRDASIQFGFQEIDGPTYEHLDLYTVKSGPGIVSELFSFKRSGGETEYALRPEFTPTLARMAVARGNALPVPTKWFSMPCLFRAERPQRGRLREHFQWNVDILGLSNADTDAELISVAIAGLEKLGLDPSMVQVKYSHRDVVAKLLSGLGVTDDHLPAAFDLLDKRDKMPADVFTEKASELGLDSTAVERFDQLAHATTQPGAHPSTLGELDPDDLEQLVAIHEALVHHGITDWCHVDLGIVRGLAYYTGTVFEIHETSGAERAIAGGGRYDHLVELFGGPATPACGFGMGDVVLSLVLQDRGLLDTESLLPRPDAFVVCADDGAADQMVPVLARLRQRGLHARRSYKSTRNMGKLLKEAGQHRSRCAVILGREFQDGIVIVKDLDAGEQHDVPLTELESTVIRLLKTS
ncbi:MAG: histidine--tRNA ligase [Phycisphaerae bacterium]|nr:histidine--tRNA ligase [Phycisphaerae bacterium]